MPQVFNLRHHKYPEGLKKIVDRSTPYGNPFIIGKDGNRDDVCNKFDLWVEQPEQAGLRLRAKSELKGHNLGCWCVPLRCHATTWLKIANS